MEGFLGRLEWLADGRSFHSWLNKELGWSNGAITRVRDGNVTGSDLLSVLPQVENISLSWLLAAQGTPFIVQHIGTKDEAEHLMLLGDNDCLAYDWQGGSVIVIGRPETLPSTGLRYRRYNVLVTKFSAEPFAELVRPSLGQRLADAQVSDLAKGWFPPRRVFSARAAPPLTMFGVEEPVTQYAMPPSGTRIGLLPLLEKLDDTDFQLLKTIAERMAKSKR